MVGHAKKSTNKITVEIEFTEGYEQRYTAAVLKIYSDRKRRLSGEVKKQAAS